ncbi:ABC-type transport system periplasmic substrate-binding protein (probable substrate iron) [Salinarchaeum sp. Harcht-Bsk1]|uniref:extracellular solute-binding protein n=1 Tax=Salinarchaeum sp. Harcht-Bsk1 TaxID=1333523 RepID=UPI0003424685|nr:extracellular solute-binding protein [Salinarchaeum sp. Harcht-Bsk1]AGN01788.1 ABC-type transport system periplasmic substrate-binding protein (probable substrate iron) [Salinarchaeum sp. Harcht-Bsk1]
MTDTPRDSPIGRAPDDRDGRSSRRAFLASAGALGAVGLAGCIDFPGGGNDDSEPFNWIGSGPGARLGQDGTPMSAMPDLEGELTVYSGRHQFLVGDLIDSINSLYDDFHAEVRYGGSSSEMVNQIITEGSGTPADVFYSVNAGSLGSLAESGRTQALSSDLLELVRPEFHTDQWIGTSGRARSVPYNTNAFSASELPDDIMAYPDLDADFGWAPTYGSCQAFVTAMRILEGDEATRQWIEGMLDQGIQTYPDEFVANQAIADGEIDVGFTNHYYIQRVLDGNPDAPIATAFTQGDAGATFNVAGAAVVDQANDPTLAENFVRHLLSAEAQAYFAVETFEYPLAPGVDPVGDLPRIDELDVPDVDLAQLGDMSGTVDLMESAGVEL